jgi:hypothetical protein
VTGRAVRLQALACSEVGLIGSCRLEMTQEGVKGRRKIGQFTARRRRVAAVGETQERH